MSPIISIKLVSFLATIVSISVMFNGCASLASAPGQQPPAVSSLAATESSQKYQLSISIDPPASGSVVASPEGAEFAAGINVTLTAIPAPGYEFDHWYGDATGISSNTTVTIDAKKSVAAFFRISDSFPTPRIGSLPTVTLSPDDVPRVTVQELNNKIDSGVPLVLIDTRGTDEYASGHIPGALFYSELESSRWQPPTDKELVFYCA